MVREYKGQKLEVADNISEREWELVKLAIDSGEKLRDPTPEEIAANKELIANVTYTPTWPGAIKGVKPA